jgi:hypothetical protein
MLKTSLYDGGVGMCEYPFLVGLYFLASAQEPGDVDVETVLEEELMLVRDAMFSRVLGAQWSC